MASSNAEMPATGFDLDRYIARARPMIEAELERALEGAEKSRDAARMRRATPEPLGEAMRYALLGEGKRLRPVLTLAAADAVSGGAVEARLAAMDLGCAVEMIHAYSLVHDDLPAMDDDDLRRGRPTAHKAFDEATAILAGDALQALAFATVARADALRSRLRVLAVDALSRGAGPTGMVGGQMMDLVAEGRYRGRLGKPDVDLEKLETLASCKTGALISAAAELGAIAAGAGPLIRRRLAEYGAAVGLAFQITDDLLDAEGSAEEVGKATGKDVGRGKVTFPALLGAREARRKAERLAAAATKIAARFPNEGGLALAGIAEWAVRRRN